MIENKLGLKKLINQSKDEIKFDEKAIRDFAVNGALYYATGLIESKKCHEAIAIGIAGDNRENLEIKVYYVYGSSQNAFKALTEIKTLNFLENETSFNEFYKNAILSEEEKQQILIDSRASLQKQAKSLNKLMHNLNITSPQRVLYVSGMHLSMQDILDENENMIQAGLNPEDLKGIQTQSNRDGVKIINQIQEFLNIKNIPQEKQNLMLASFRKFIQQINKRKALKSYR